MESSGQPPAAPPAPGAVSDHPVTFSVEYPDRKLNRLTTAFRIFVVIPILIVAATLGGGYLSTGDVGDVFGTIGDSPAGSYSFPSCC